MPALNSETKVQKKRHGRDIRHASGIHDSFKSEDGEGNTLHETEIII
jgi:hypothetical protein